MVPLGLVDSHLHIGDRSRVGELGRYAELLGLSRVGCLSLPTVGADAALPGARAPAVDAAADGEGSSRRANLSGAAGPVAALGPTGRIINFNPEVLLAVHTLPGVADGFGSFDNRALLAAAMGAGAGAERGKWSPAAQVAEMHAAGFRAIKMWEGKPDLQGALGITLDDPRLIEAYQEAARLTMPVLIHVADPQLFWERSGGPWSYVGRPVPSFEELMRQADAVCVRSPETTFIFPHLLFLADEPERMGRFLADHPNALYDLAPGNYLYPALGGAATVARPADPARRQAAITFFETYADRVMLGSDSFFLPRDLELLPGSPLSNNLERFLRLYRFLATEECFGTPYPARADEVPMVRGLGLAGATPASDAPASGGPASGAPAPGETGPAPGAPAAAGGEGRAGWHVPDAAAPGPLLEAICGGNYRRLLGETAPQPDKGAALAYLDGWGAGIPEAEARASEIAAAIEAL